MVSAVPPGSQVVLPPEAILLHAGMPKTGTTALQRAAAAQRELIAAHGACYPGSRINHRKALFAYSSRSTGWVGAGDNAPDRAHWERLRREIRAQEGRRVWLDNENLSDEPEEVLHRLVADLGREAHVVLTVRSLPSQLASSWQQYLKGGVWTSFETWLERTLGADPDPTTTPLFLRRLAVGDVVDTWARVVGPDRVLVVVLDPDDRALVSRTFEGLLGLPDGSLGEDALRGRERNRSMTAGEAELVRRVNRIVREAGGVSWPDYKRLVRQGAVEAMLERTPPVDEPKLVAPDWAVERAVGLAEGCVTQISAAGVRVVGDLQHLAAAGPSSQEVSVPATVSIDAAAAALTAVLSSGLGRGRSFAAVPPPDRPVSSPVPDRTPAGPVALEDVSSRRLLRHLAGRARSRLSAKRPGR